MSTQAVNQKRGNHVFWHHVVPMEKFPKKGALSRISKCSKLHAQVEHRQQVSLWPPPAAQSKVIAKLP
eukprot:6472614-Amphidinium_carterae.1